jgi:hypothetical protein
VALYVIYLFNVKDNPSFSHMQQIPPALIACLGITALFIFIYLICFLYTLFFTLCNFCSIPMRSRILFLYALFMLCVCVSTLIVGVYSPYYSNGGIFMFFLALFNVYVYSLIYLNWPKDLLTPIILHEQIEL